MAESPRLLARLFLLVAFLSAALAQSAITPETSRNASIWQYPGNSGWTYEGCHNETVTANGSDSGLRALVQSDGTGTSTSSDNMTVKMCLDFCAEKNFPLAGVEYTRECYCSQTIRSEAVRDDASCNLACQGNTTQICGGYRAISVYQNSKNSKKSASSKGFQETSVGSVLALGIAVGAALYLT